jgi:NAD-dependent dihydropyrimidine dehydrogenase PreA subunit
VRSKGEQCTICVDQCPLGATAIELREGKIDVHPLGCIGCGVCQYYCPTNPKSITVIPKSAKER